MTVGGVGSGEWRKNQWENEESTASIMKRDTGVEVHGNDKTWRETKDEQQNHVGKTGGGKIGVAFVEGAELAGLVHGGATMAIALPIAAFGLAWAGMVHAHKDGDAQKAALANDTAHVGLTRALDLPDGCKEKAYAARPGVAHEEGAAYKVAEQITSDPAGRAVLQAHCDRGITSAVALVPSKLPAGMTAEQFIDGNPALKKICDEDAAFKIGFSAYFNGSPAEQTEMKLAVQARDGRAMITFEVRG